MDRRAATEPWEGRRLGSPAVDRSQQRLQVIDAAEHHAAGDRRHQLRIRSQRRDQPLDVVVFRSRPVTRYCVGHDYPLQVVGCPRL